MTERTQAISPRPGTTPAWRYAIGMFGTSIPINMIKGSMILFYVDILGLDVRAYGAVMVIYAIIDAIDNPVLGHLSDRTRSRFGRRRPWLLVGAPMLAACMIAFFSAPASLDGVGLLIWFAVFAILCEAFDSMLNANYGALLPELYPRERDRAVANGLRQGFQLVALVISLAVTPLLTTKVFGTENSTQGFQTTAIIYGAIAVVVIVFMALGARENPRYSTRERPPLLGSVWSIVRTPMFWTVGLTGACYGIAMALVLTGIQLYVRYSLGLAVENALYLQGIVILVAALGLVLWTKVVARRGALWTWRLAFAVLAVSFAALFFATDLITAIAAGVLVGAGWSGMLATNDLIVARVLDADAARNGEHREGLFLSAFGFFGRLNGIVSGIALTSLGVFFGYNSGADPGTDPGLAFRVYLCVYPFALTTIGAIAARLISVPLETPPEATEPPATPQPPHTPEPPARSESLQAAPVAESPKATEPVDAPHPSENPEPPMRPESLQASPVAELTETTEPVGAPHPSENPEPPTRPEPLKADGASERPEVAGPVSSAEPAESRASGIVDESTGEGPR